MGFIRKLENIYAAAAFGECGEWETARDMAGDKSPYISERLGTAVRKGSPAKDKADKRTTPPRPRVSG
ncbi:MAG: hypothetical protein SVS15_03400 [Thermodesulfobacteriota bacterium]|nr:hypothetical protein [Thermodesulfobacteriota bacterium]